MYVCVYLYDCGVLFACVKQAKFESSHFHRSFLLGTVVDGQGTLCSTTHFPFCAFFHGTASNTHTAGSVCVWEGEGKSVVTVLVEGHHC